MGKVAVVTGATGLVGRELLKIILASDYYSEIIVVARRPLPIKDNRIKEIIIEFDQLESISEQLAGHDFFCCLGTTMKQAGSKENFKKVDFDYPLKLAEIAKKSKNFTHFQVVTAYGADAESALFYNQIKGELEDALKAMDLPSLQIFQPSLLLGAREDFRFGEELAKFATTILSFFIIRINKLWSIKGSEVAQAMFNLARHSNEKLAVYKPSQIRKLAEPS